MKIKTNTTLYGDSAAVPVATPTSATAPIAVDAAVGVDSDDHDAPYPAGEDPHFGWKRSELDAYARELGIENPEDAANKGAVLALIEGV